MSNENELNTVTTLSHITDEETGEVVEITSDLRDEALQVHGQIEGAFWQLATALSRIKNEKLYLALGYGSFKGYCQETLPFGVRNAYHYAIVGERIGARLLEAGESAKPVSQSLENMGINKLKMLATKAEDQIDSLIREGKINLNDIQLSDDEISEMSVKKFKAALEKAESKAARYEVEAEKRKNTELENEHLLKENEELKELDKKYRDRSITQAQVEEDLAELDECWEKIQKIVTRVEVEDLPEAVKLKFVERLNRIESGSQRFNNMHMELLLIFNDPTVV